MSSSSALMKANFGKAAGASQTHTAGVKNNSCAAKLFLEAVLVQNLRGMRDYSLLQKGY
jgi:hypothetical protein